METENAFDNVIDTEYGKAQLWWDNRNPDEVGWHLRYHLEPRGEDDTAGRRHLDQSLSTIHLGEARDAAMEFLRREGVAFTDPSQTRLR